MSEQNNVLPEEPTAKPRLRLRDLPTPLRKKLLPPQTRHVLIFRSTKPVWRTVSDEFGNLKSECEHQHTTDNWYSKLLERDVPMLRQVFQVVESNDTLFLVQDLSSNDKATVRTINKNDVKPMPY
jgi:hypothetical protein